MKLSKKVIAAFSAAAALAVAGTFVSCSDDDDDNDENGWISWDGKNATITADNSAGENDQRAWRFEDDHYNAVETITITDLDKAKSSPVGYIFGYQAKDGKASFGLAGIRVNSDKTQLYVSWYKNIDVANGINIAGEKNFGVKDAQSFTTADEFKAYEGDLPAEFDATKAYAKATYADVSYNLNSDKKEVGGTIDLRSFEDGSYKIRAYQTSSKAKTDRDASKFYDSGLFSKETIFLKNTTAESDRENEANALQIGADSTVKSIEIPATVTGLTEATKLKVGAYVNAVKSTTVNATITVSDDRGADEVVEE